MVIVSDKREKGVLVEKGGRKGVRQAIRKGASYSENTETRRKWPCLRGVISC